MPTLRLRSRLLRATSVGLCLAMAAVPGAAQIRPGAAERARALNAQAQQKQAASNNAAAAATANPAATPQAQPEAQAQHIIRHIVVHGTQRVEPATVLTYVNIREGDTYSPADIDQAIKTLSATGLFLDIKTSFDPDTGTLTIRVTENPIVNRVEFEGNSKVSDKDLTKEVQIKPRSVFTRAKVKADVQRIVELYRRNGKFAARVDPEIIQRPQNRVDLIFSIHEGPSTGVSRITFTGNHVFDDATLRGQIATGESAWWKFLATNDNYDPDRMAFDREQLRRYYLNHGYADFKVLSSVAELTPDRKSFYINFTVSEGPRYHFGKISIDSKIKELPESKLLPSINAKEGDLFSQKAIQDAIESLTNAAGTQGYAFAQVHPRFTRNPKTRTIDLGFNIVQGPRVYIEKIDITGNTRTLDKVIRREFRLQEGDAFNRVLVDRSRTRIRNLGFFKDVEVRNVKGSQPDRTDLTVNVTEQPTGALSLGLGYSSFTSLLGEFAYTDTNWFGRGQRLRLSVQASQITRQIQFSFTEPYFLDRPLSAGFDLYKVSTDFSQANYRSNVTAGVLRLGFPVSEFSSVSLSARYQVEKVRFFGVTSAVASQAGSFNGIIMGVTYGYNNLDDVRKPTKGISFSLSQSFAGFTGNMKFLDSAAGFNAYTPLFGGSVVGSFGVRAGYITGYNGYTVPFEERKFMGGDTFRGFALAGIGPRDINAPKDTGALGGTTFAVGTLEARLPSLLPPSWGVSAGLFMDFGTLGRLDVKPPNTGPCILHSQLGSCIKDNLAFRASTGVSIGWKSPFGPVQIDIGLPFVKTKYDRAQLIHFSTATGL